MRTWLPLSMVSLALAGPTAGPAVAHGVPTFDLRLFAERQAILEQTDRDLALQQDRLTREEELAEIERQQLASLEGLMGAMSLGSGDVAGTVAGLEAGQGAVDDVESAAASLYAPDDNNPAAARVNALERHEEALIDCGVDPAHVIRAALRRAVKTWQLRPEFVPPSEEQRTRITEWRARTSLAVDANALTSILHTHDPLDVLSKWALIRGQIEPRVWAEIDVILDEIAERAAVPQEVPSAPRT